jgi:nitroreductase
MEFCKVVVSRRSIRRFKEDPVSDVVVGKVLEAGRWAPSAGNTQPWRFVVVTSLDVKRKIADLCTESSKKAWARFSPARARYLAQRGGSWDKSGMATVPVLIAVCYEVLAQMREELVLASAWAAVENMLLAATDEGLSGCVYTFYDLDEENGLRGILQVPEGHRVATLIQLGYSKGSPPSPSRKPLKQIVSYQHF